MIKCNLNVLLAERNLKITQVAKDTGLSRTTLTYMANNYSQGIQLDTLNKLCLYLQVTPDRFFSYLPFDIMKNYRLRTDNLKQHNNPCELNLKFLTKSKIEETFVYAILDADFFKFPSEEDEDEMKTGATKLNVTIQLPSPGEVMEIFSSNVLSSNNDIFKKYFKQIPASFLKDIELEILNDIAEIASDIKIKKENCSLSWPNELF